MTTYLSAAVSMADNPLLYNILLAALSVATLAFLLFIIIDYKLKDGNDERDRIIMFLGNSKKGKQTPWHLHPSRWYNSFMK